MLRSFLTGYGARGDDTARATEVLQKCLGGGLGSLHAARSCVSETETKNRSCGRRKAGAFAAMWHRGKEVALVAAVPSLECLLQPAALFGVLPRVKVLHATQPKLTQKMA